MQHLKSLSIDCKARGNLTVANNSVQGTYIEYVTNMNSMFYFSYNDRKSLLQNRF